MMNLKFLVSMGLTAALMLSACKDDDVPKKVVPQNNTTEETGSTDDKTAEVVDPEEPKDNQSNGKDLSGYTAQDGFNLADVKLCTVSYNTEKTYQYVQGFGAMLTPKYWAPSPTPSQIDACFNEYGLNILRLYIYPDKTNWKQDIDVVQEAVKDGAIILACPWEAPSDLVETTSNIVWSDGERAQLQKEVKHLKYENWQAYADHLVDYVAYMKEQGVTIDAMSVQNEPDAEFMYWDPKEIREFVEQYGSYIVQKTGVKLCAPEACGMREDYTNQILDNASAYANTDIIAGHLYQGFSNIDDVHSTSSYVKNRYDYINSIWDKIKADNKEWWMTEHLFNDGQNSTASDEWLFLNWDYCLNHLGLEIQDCMKASASAYIYWYLKRFYGLIYDADSKGRSGDNPENSYAHNLFIMSQWARYATGKTRIDASCDDSNVNVTAYKSADGKQLSFVAINFGSTSKYLSISLDSDDFVAYGTTCDKNSQAKQQLTDVLPNCFTKRVVLKIPAMGIGSVAVEL